jgi:hypothetical protein
MDTLTFKKNDQVVVSYHFSNGLLTREENNSGNSYPLMDTLSAVSGLQFYYFQQDGITAATDSDAIRFIQVYLTTQRGATITRFFQLRNAISINSTGHPKL